MTEIDLLIEDTRWKQAAAGDVETIIRQCAHTTLAHTDNRPETTISVLLADDARIALLNEEFRGKTGPTNILSFPAVDAPHFPDQEPILGDLALAFQTVSREAEEAGKPFLNHFRHLIVHGVLHLLGFDHEVETDAAIMEGIERDILSGLGIPDPYADIDAVIDGRRE